MASPVDSNTALLSDVIEDASSVRTALYLPDCPSARFPSCQDRSALPPAPIGVGSSVSPQVCFAGDSTDPTDSLADLDTSYVKFSRVVSKLGLRRLASSFASLVCSAVRGSRYPHPDRADVMELYNESRALADISLHVEDEDLFRTPEASPTTNTVKSPFGSRYEVGSSSSQAGPSLTDSSDVTLASTEMISESSGKLKNFHEDFVSTDSCCGERDVALPNVRSASVLGVLDLHVNPVYDRESDDKAGFEVSKYKPAPIAAITRSFPAITGMVGFVRDSHNNPRANEFSKMFVDTQFDCYRLLLPYVRLKNDASIASSS